ncbi:hypothetical protein BTO06_12285 [Tenacibaculum sp. SZ-18]|nr:hypothetical protein BTO06_12285 [Tenacibaculum sp. SZ-18]
MRGLALNFASTHGVGNSAGISKVDENKQLLIAIVASSIYFRVNILFSSFFIPFSWYCTMLILEFLISILSTIP